MDQTQNHQHQQHNGDQGVDGSQDSADQAEGGNVQHHIENAVNHGPNGAEDGQHQRLVQMESGALPISGHKGHDQADPGEIGYNIGGFLTHGSLSFPIFCLYQSDHISFPHMGQVERDFFNRILILHPGTALPLPHRMEKRRFYIW